MLPDSQPLPGLTRLINRTADYLLKNRDPLLGIEGDELMDNVSFRLGRNDYGDNYFREGFNMLIRSLKAEPDLTFLGKLLARTALERSLENRLRFTDYRKKHPEVFAGRLKRPIIILGFPRSGTTFLHRLLARDPENRGLFLWELVHPIPPVDQRDLRELTAKIEYGAFRRFSINMDHIHVIRDSEYEECIWLQATTFQSVAYWVMAPVYSYLQWCLKTDRINSYDEYNQLLKIYQAQTPGRRLTLKAPAHTGSLVEIRRYIPDAVIVQTHRHPVEICNSTNSLVYWAHCNTVNRLDIPRMCRCNMDLLDSDMRRNLFSRKYHGIKVHDIWYEQLISDPMAAVRSIYDAHGLELTDAAESQMNDYIRSNPRNKHGAHKYRAVDFGMTSGEINDMFEYYLEAFGYPRKP